VNKKILQALAEARVADARALLNAKRFDAAYYLAGYAIECALKACIAKRTRLHDFPDKEFARKVYTHDLDDLLGIAGLKGQLQQRFHQDPALEAKWGIVKDWSEQARYEMAGPQRESLRRAREMLNAVAD
jgi:HEPN domain-containing protein